MNNSRQILDEANRARLNAIIQSIQKGSLRNAWLTHILIIPEKGGDYFLNIYPAYQEIMKTIIVEDWKKLNG